MLVLAWTKFLKLTGPSFKLLRQSDPLRDPLATTTTATQGMLGLSFFLSFLMAASGVRISPFQAHQVLKVLP